MVKGQPGRQEAVRGRLPGRSCSDHDYMEEKARVMKETERDAPPPPTSLTATHRWGSSLQRTSSDAPRLDPNGVPRGAWVMWAVPKGAGM